MAEQPKERPHCRICGSTDLLRDAWARWDDDQSQWVLEEVFDYYHCNNCCGESKFAEFR